MFEWSRKLFFLSKVMVYSFVEMIRRGGGVAVMQDFVAMSPDCTLASSYLSMICSRLGSPNQQDRIEHKQEETKRGRAGAADQVSKHSPFTVAACMIDPHIWRAKDRTFLL